MKNFYKKIEIWGDFTITVTDFEETYGEPIIGVLITSHSPDQENEVGGSFDSPQCIYVHESEIGPLIEALKEFTGGYRENA